MVPAQNPPTPPTLTPQQAFKQAEALRDAIKADNSAVATDLGLLDNLARARDFRGIEKLAAALSGKAKIAAGHVDDLDKLQTAINEAAKRRA